MNNKHIEALNLSIINQNRQMNQAKDLLNQWMNEVAVKECHQKLIDRTKKFLNIV
jgi:hypothetical protein